MPQSDIDDGKAWPAADRRDVKPASAAGDTLRWHAGSLSHAAVTADELGLTFGWGDRRQLLAPTRGRAYRRAAPA
jgi:hypothetical protein